MLNPDDVRINFLLKGIWLQASFYGSRGGNGVILVTTKQGRGKVKYNNSNFTF